MDRDAAAPLPHDFPPWSVVYQQVMRWLRAGMFEAMAHDLRLHAAVDTLGHLLAAHVTPADEQNRAQVDRLAAAVSAATGEGIEIAYVDQGYTGEQPAADAARQGLRLILTAGHRGDAPQAKALPGEDRPDAVLADAAYDSDTFRAAIGKAGATAVIPNNLSRAKKHPFDKGLCKERHFIECGFAKLNQFCRVATRYEKTARNCLAVVTLAATILWPR